MTDPEPAPKPPGSFSGLGEITSGIVAGLVSALAAVAATSGLPLVTAFSIFASLPILLVGLVNGPRAAIIASAVAALGVGAVSAFVIGLATFALAFGPAAYMSYLLNLARPADELGGPSDGMAWYPLADTIFRTCLAVALGTVVVGLLFNYESDAVRAALAQLIDEMVAVSANPEQLGTEAERAVAVNTVVAVLPAAQPFGSVLSLLANMYLAIKIGRARGLVKRPPDDMRLALRLPSLGLLVFGIALAFSFSDGTLGLVARVFAGALAAGFMVAGFAIVHFALRASAVKTPVLFGLYVATAIAVFPAFLMMALGLFSTARAVPISKQKD